MSFETIKKRIRNLWREWMARRAGRKHMGPNNLGKAARHMAGPTGELWSNGWETMAQNKDAYLKSFDDHIPPSLFVSERDRTRLNQAMPLPERAIPDVVAGDADKPTEADYEEAFRALDAEVADSASAAADAPGNEDDSGPDDDRPDPST